MHALKKSIASITIEKLRIENMELKKEIKKLRIENQAQSDAIDGLQEMMSHYELEGDD